jgi:uncharacterized SAM-binding protein YcdF (DUF218 family)
VAQAGAGRPPQLAVGLAVGALAGSLARDLDFVGALSFWGDTAISVVVGALTGALLWRTPLRPLLAVVTVGLGLLWSVVAFTPLSGRLAAGLVRADPMAPADAVLVLGSRLQSDGDFTPQAEGRLLRGLELLAEGLAPRLILTEQPPLTVRHETSARRLMNGLRLEGELLAVGPTNNTHDEAVAAAALCRSRGWTRLLVVTSPTHTARACPTVERQGIAVVCVPAVETRFDLEGLDRPLDRLALFTQVLHERLGAWVYRRRGWIA